MAYEKKTVQEYIAETDDKTVEGFNDNQETRIKAGFDNIETDSVQVGVGGIQSDGLISTSAGISIPDTRAVVDNPEDFRGQSYRFDFKSASSVGNPPVSATSSYSYILTIAGWKSNGTAGWPIQVSFGASGIATRQGTSATTWGNWTRVGS